VKSKRHDMYKENRYGLHEVIKQ